MILKVLHIDVDGFKRNDTDKNNILDGRIKEEKLFKDKEFYCYKHFVNSKAASYGVRKPSGKLIALNDDLRDEGSRLYKCRFIAINTKKKLLFYDGDLNDVGVILKSLFDIETNKVSNLVSIEEFEKLRELKITTTTDAQLHINNG